MENNNLKLKYKSLRYSQNNKRNEFIIKQLTKRRNLINQIRLLNELNNENKNNKKEKNKKKENKKLYLKYEKKNEIIINQLCIPEWMIEIPEDLILNSTPSSSSSSSSTSKKNNKGSNWFILPRPEGKRCLIISSKGKTISYLESGQILHYFRSVLPGGGLSSRQGSSAILDCIYSPINHTYYILDLMNWNEMSCYECDAEFRFYWLHTKYSETPGLGTPPVQQSYSFKLIPYWECTQNNLLEAYNCEVDFIKNGLLFYHREGHLSYIQ